MASDWRSDPTWPDVDVVMPIRNEADQLADAVASVRAQHYPGALRIFVGVGPSDDGTEAVVADLVATESDLVAIDNPTGKTPAALNLAIAAGSAPVIVRVDGHSQLSDGYIERAVATLRRTGAANVGGMQVPVPTTPFEEAVAAATTSWLGTGGASYRTGGVEASVDTVYLGVFDRAAIEGVGLFDERLIRNQDYELNIRLRKAGGEVVFDPELSVGYTPRGSWKTLAKQYFEYGQWKAEVLRMHPDSLKLRQFAPALFTVAIVIGTVGGTRFRRFWIVPSGYIAVLAIGGFVASPNRRVLTAGVLGLMHMAWGSGFWRKTLSISRR